MADRSPEQRRRGEHADPGDARHETRARTVRADEPTRADESNSADEPTPTDAVAASARTARTAGAGGYGPSDRERWVPEDPRGKRRDRDDFARDRARLLHSAGLRRLAATTQVMQPDADDFARTRLTHSLEVAQIGRELAGLLGCSADVVDTACLAHDLGHPPFGHNGEQILHTLCADIGGFEGNAQTLRVLTRLEAKRAHPDGASAGLNLTRASLDAATKYPWRRQDAPGAALGASGAAKFGVYEDDLGVFDWMRRGAPPRGRCLEAQVMDWADDVAYSVHDVEDAVAGEHLDLRVLTSRTDLRAVYAVARQWYAPDLDDAQLEAAGARLLGALGSPGSMAGPIGSGVLRGYDGSRAALAGLKDLTSLLIGRFVGAARDATRAAYGPGPLRRYDADLLVPQDVRAECVLLKAVAAHFVMLAPERLADRRAEQEVLAELVAAIEVDPAARLDPALRDDYVSAADDAARRRVVIDQVASLSDVRAWHLHARWCR